MKRMNHVKSINSAMPRRLFETNMDQVESERSFVANEADESVIIDYPQRVSGAEGEGEDFLSVDELQACGIGAVDIQKLKLAGICTIKVSKKTRIISNFVFSGYSYDV